MLLRYVTPLLGILGAFPQVAAAQALQIPATESVALPRKDVGDGLCATVVHAADPRLGQVAFSGGVDDANALLNQTSMRLNEDGRTGSLFSLINFARHAGINPEEALERTNRKFIQRFQYLETQSAREGHQLANLTLAQMDVYWEEAKRLAGQQSV